MVILSNCCLWFIEQTAGKFACIDLIFLTHLGMRLRFGFVEEDKSTRFRGKLILVSCDSSQLLPLISRANKMTSGVHSLKISTTLRDTIVI